MSWIRLIFFENRNAVIVDELTNRGHNVTVISPYSNKNAPPGAHYIPFGDDFQSGLPEFVKMYMSSHERMNPFLEQFVFADSYINACSGTFI